MSENSFFLWDLGLSQVHQSDDEYKDGDEEEKVKEDKDDNEEYKMEDDDITKIIKCLNFLE